jgi:hypothetical protein
MALHATEYAERLARIEGCIESLSARLNSNDTLIKTIYELTSDIKVLTQQVKAQGDRMEQIALHYENKLEEQGERIGALEKEPAHKWKLLISQLTAIIAAGLIGAAIGFFTS